MFANESLIISINFIRPKRAVGIILIKLLKLCGEFFILFIRILRRFLIIYLLFWLQRLPQRDYLVSRQPLPRSSLKRFQRLRLSPFKLEFFKLRIPFIERFFRPGEFRLLSFWWLRTVLKDMSIKSLLKRRRLWIIWSFIRIRITGYILFWNFKRPWRLNTEVGFQKIIFSLKFGVESWRFKTFALPWIARWNFRNLRVESYNFDFPCHSQMLLRERIWQVWALDYPNRVHFPMFYIPTYILRLIALFYLF